MRINKVINILIVLLLIGGLCYGFYYVYENYTVSQEQVTVEGNRHYTKQQIMHMVMSGPLGNNSLFLSLKYKEKKITGVPFVDSITVTVTSNDSIKISVYEKALAGYIKYLDQYVYFDKDGFAIESSTMLTEGIPQVCGIVFNSVELGKKIGAEDDTLFLRTLDVTNLMRKYSLSVDKIYFHEDGDLTIYFGDVRVDLGNESTHLEDKVMDLPQFLQKLEGMKGVLNMEKYDADYGLYVFSTDK